jgi:putative inorganic carbon (HCO3(-)) transporter
MDGSLFFRAVAAVMLFAKNVAAGSFIAGFFVNDYDEDSLKHSRFGRWCDRVLNCAPKWLTPPEAFPKRLSNGLRGSRLINAVCEGLDTPIPQPGKASWASVLRWVLYALPVWGLLAVLAAAPFLPTMVLAAGLAAVTLLTLFRQRLIITPFSAAVLFFVGVTLFCGVTSFHAASSIPIAVLTSVFMLSALLTGSLLTRKRQTDFFFFAFLAASAGTGLVGLYQLVTRRMDMTWVDEELFGDIQFRLISTFGNPNVFGTYLLLAIPLAAALVLYAKKPLHRLFALSVTGLLLVNLLLSYSRGCYLALALSAFVFVLLVEKRLIILSVAGLFALPLVLPPTMLNRLLSITNLADSSTSYRIFIWQGTLRVLRDFWMTGLGQGLEAYNVIYPYYAFNAVVAPHSHNLFLQVFVETGIVGLAAFLVMLAWFFRTMAVFLRRAAHKRDAVVAAAMTAAVVGFLFQGIFDHVFYNYRVMLIFFLFVGLACAFARVSEKKEAKA